MIILSVNYNVFFYSRFYVLRVTCMIGIIPLLADIAVSVFVGDLDLVKIHFY